MNQFLPYFILIPLLGCVFNFFTSDKKEDAIFWISVLTVSLHFTGLIALSVFWISNNMPVIFSKAFILYKARGSDFSVSFYFDYTTVVYVFVASILTFLVTIFSRYYMHREKGYKRFFNNVLFFFLGLNFILFAGNFETLFIGWEILGVTSFFLIGFYRDRYLPVKNAFKVISLFRLADIALLLGIWLCHHYFERNISFADLANAFRNHQLLIRETAYQILIPAIFMLAALIKSAQFPFSSWLPRAMEGPSTSSAIFYGALSVHIGVFLMIRTYPLWESSVAFKVVVILLGLVTSMMATITARVQSSVKTQIAYSSIAQIGLMFIEVALGLHWLALIHFASNAFLRCYQLLVSPSVLSYLIHDQFFNFIPPQNKTSNTFIGKIRMTLYVLGIKEWNLDAMMYRTLWKPLKTLGNAIHFISPKSILYFFTPLYAIGLYFVYHKDLMPPAIMPYLPVVFALTGLVMILKAFVDRHKAGVSWLMVIMNQLYTALSIAFNEQFGFEQVHIFLSGILVSGLVGYLCINKLTKYKEPVTLDRFHGHSLEHPGLAFVFVVASLGLAGFPITPTFIGEDFIIGHIHQNQISLTLLTALNLILDGLVVFRIYSRLFLGPHPDSQYEMAYRSS